MPSKTPKQARYMRAVAHGMKPRGGGGPSREVAEEFEHADERSGRFAGRSKGKRKESVTSKRARNNRLGYKADRVSHLTRHGEDY